MISSFVEKPKNMLVYHGSPGIGKTYLLAALTEWAFIRFRSRRYHREEGVLRRLRDGIGEGKGDYLIALEYLIDDDLVMFDDVGSGINPTKTSYKDLEWRREIFLEFLDYRYNCQKPTIVTSNFTKDEFIQVYSDRIVDRLFAKENTIISLFGEVESKRKQGL